MAKYKSHLIRSALVGLTLAYLNTSPLVLAAQTKPDNTGVNKQDRSPAAVTADQQKNTRSDVEILRDIRRAVVSDKSLSTYAHNVKIVAQSGKVTLRGPVRTETEKELIQAKAAEAVGAANVTNLITVVPKKSTK